MRRIVTVEPGQPLEGIDFTIAAGPAAADEAIRVGAMPTQPPADEAIRVDATPTEVLALAASAQAVPTSAATSNGWLGPALLGTAGGLLLAFAAATRWGFRRPR